MNRHCTSDIVMIRPASFCYNEETATNNAYQHKTDNSAVHSIQQKALHEFDVFAAKLSDAGVNTIIIPDKPEPPKPDAIFPNNWISFHEDGAVVLYPMYAVNRRTERRKDILETLEKQCGFSVSTIIDLTHYEQEGKFLEGTGSLVLDRVNKIAYASVSERTSPELVEEFCKHLNYKPVFFHALEDGVAVYHTNVLISVCSKFVVICLDYISSEDEKRYLIEVFRSTGKEVLAITKKQASCFAGNMLELSSKKGESLLVMSTCAFNSLDRVKVSFLQKNCNIIHSPLDTIEKHGGGSARCMIAEVFLPSR